MRNIPHIEKQKWRCIMSWKDDFGWGLGFGFGYTATEGAINAVSNRYRAKDFDPIVRQDLLDIMTKGRLASIAYPFPKDFKQPKRPLFIFRHKIFSISVGIFFLIVMFNPNIVLSDSFERIAAGFVFFWFACVAVMLVKKVLRGGKKASDVIFQSEFINQGKRR